MAILISVTEISNRQGVHKDPISKLYGIPHFSLTSDNTTSSTIIIDGKNNNEERIISESYATIKSATEVGYIDFMLALNSTDGTQFSLKASKIVEIYNEENKGVVRYRDNEKSEDIFYRVNENIASIINLIPSSGGITSESDPIFTNHAASNVIDSGSGSSFLSDDGTYKTITESDPIFTNHAAFNVIDSGSGSSFLSDDGTYKTISSDNIYTTDGTVTSNRVVGITDNLTFGDVMTIAQGTNRVLIKDGANIFTIDPVQSNITELRTNTNGFHFLIEGGGRHFRFNSATASNILMYLNGAATGFDFASKSGIVRHSFFTEGSRAGEVILNESGVSTGDFRVESVTDQNNIFSNATTNSVGFGTNSPSAKVHIEEAGATGGTTAFKVSTGLGDVFEIKGDRNSSLTGGTLTIRSEANNTNGLVVKGSTDHVTRQVGINGIGVLMIGHLTPDSRNRVDVVYSENSAARVSVENLNTASSASSELQLKSNSNTAKFIVNSSGKVTDPSAAILSSSGGNLILNAGGSGDDIHFRTQSTNHLTILNTGRVGIETSTPTEALDVNGSINTNAPYKTNGNSGVASFSGTASSITVENGIITAIS